MQVRRRKVLRRVWMRMSVGIWGLDVEEEGEEDGAMGRVVDS